MFPGFGYTPNFIAAPVSDDVAGDADKAESSVINENQEGESTAITEWYLRQEMENRL